MPREKKVYKVKNWREKSSGIWHLNAKIMIDFHMIESSCIRQLMDNMNSIEDLSVLGPV